MRRRSMPRRSAAACPRACSRRVREKRGLCYSIYAFAQSSNDSGIIGVYTGTGEEEAGEIAPVIAGEMALWPRPRPKPKSRAPRRSCNLAC